jgi:hypothetical protein
MVVRAQASMYACRGGVDQGPGKLEAVEGKACKR